MLYLFRTGFPVERKKGAKQMDNVKRIIEIIKWADEVAENMTEEEWEHLHDGEEKDEPLFG